MVILLLLLLIIIKGRSIGYSKQIEELWNVIDQISLYVYANIAQCIPLLRVIIITKTKFKNEKLCNKDTV